MNILVNLFVKSVAAELTLPEPIVEIGSYQVAGQEHMANLRPYFAGHDYIGVDMRAGPGVDRVEDVQKLTFGDASIGTILMCATLEHVADPARALSEVRRVLKPGGVLVMSTPWALGIHNYPNDYWRLTPEAYNVVLAPMGQRLIGSVGPATDPTIVFGVALTGNDDREAQCTKLVARYRQELHADRQLARQRKVAALLKLATAWLPLQEARRAYRQRSHLQDTRFRFYSGEKTRDFVQ